MICEELASGSVCRRVFQNQNVNCLKKSGSSTHYARFATPTIQCFADDLDKVLTETIHLGVNFFHLYVQQGI